MLIILLLATGCSLVAPNTAEQELDKILPGLSSVHPNMQCSNGDSGRAVDNTTPWIHAYFEVDLTSDLESQLESAAKAAGFSLSRKPVPPQPSDPDGEPGDGSTLGAMDTFLRGTDNGATLEAVVAPTGHLTDCMLSGTDRRSLTPAQGKAILYLGVVMPDLNS